MQPLPTSIVLSDGVVTLDPLVGSDADALLSGEDAELQRWLSGGVSTRDTVENYLRVVEERWRTGGPFVHFAIRASEAGAFAGTLDIQMEDVYAPPGGANFAYGLVPEWRGCGLATRAVGLGIAFLREYTTLTHALIRADPRNRASSAVARRAGFALTIPAIRTVAAEASAEVAAEVSATAPAATGSDSDPAPPSSAAPRPDDGSRTGAAPPSSAAPPADDAPPTDAAPPPHTPHSPRENDFLDTYERPVT